MEQYLVWTLADMHRRELTADAALARAARARAARRVEQPPDPLRGLVRARMLYWIAADRLRRMTVKTTTFETATFETARGAR